MEKEITVKSVDRAMQLLKLVAQKKEGCGVTELSNQMDINKSSVYRILSTLVKHGLIEQDPVSGKYRLSFGILELASSLLESLDLRTQAYPYLLELEKATNEVIHLVVLDQGEVVYIEKLEGNETLRMHSKVGRRAPVHCTGVGKAILAYLPAHEVDGILEKHGMARHTERTITDKGVLLQELRKIRQRGYALDEEENELGIQCVAAPIFDHRGQVIAAISVSGPTVRMSDERKRVLIQLVKDTGAKISRRMGYRA
ncbi:IclR family transcriptional regulator [Bacillaceae bacterium]